MSDTIDRCHVYKGHHIPGCWGCAVADHRSCTCPSQSQPSRRQLEQRIDDLELRVAELQRGDGKP